MGLIQTTTIVRIKPAFKTYSDNAIQYRDAGPHNTMIDLDCTCESRESCSVAQLMTMHSMELSFYAATLPLLVRDGYVELTELEPILGGSKREDVADAMEDLFASQGETEVE